MNEEVIAQYFLNLMEIKTHTSKKSKRKIT